MLARAGFDYLIADLEHSSLDLAAVEEIVRAADVHRVPVLVRLSPMHLSHAGRALETGALGIQITTVRSVRDVATAQRAMTLAPDGELGLSFSHRAAGYGSDADSYLVRLRDEVMLIAQLESRAGLDALPELLAIDRSPDAWFLGPVDLSSDLGHAGDPAHPDVRGALERAAELIRGAGQTLSVFAGDLDAAQRWRSRGASAVVLGSDVALLTARAADAVAAWRALD